MKIKRKLWNIIKVFRQVRATLDVLDMLAQIKAKGQKYTKNTLINAVNRLLTVWEAGFTVDDLKD